MKVVKYKGREYEIYDLRELPDYVEEPKSKLITFAIRRCKPKVPMIAYVQVNKQLLENDGCDAFMIEEWLETARNSQKNEPEKWEGYVK